MPASIRLAAPADAPACREIYRPYVEHTAVSFETVAPETAEFSERIAAVLQRAPWLVCEREGRIEG